MIVDESIKNDEAIHLLKDCISHLEKVSMATYKTDPVLGLILMEFLDSARLKFLFLKERENECN